MKLIRYIKEKELDELLNTGKVVPNKYEYQNSKITFNNKPTNIKLNLHLYRYQLEPEDGMWVSYTGYNSQNVKSIEINGEKYDLCNIKSRRI